mgnify:CR=1 FL=1
MKRVLLLSLLSLCSYAQTSLDLACSQIKKPIIRIASNNLIMGSKNGLIKSFNLSNKSLIKEFSLNIKVNDFEIMGENLWVLSNRELHKVDLELGKVIESFPTSYNDYQDATKYEIAKAITKKDHLLFIANGERSLTVFDTQLLKLVDEKIFDLPQKGKHRSWATGLSIHNGKIFVGVDNITYNFSNKTRALEGIAIYDLETLKRDHIVTIRQNLEAYHEPRLFTYKGSIISNNLFLYFFNDAKKLLTQKKITPQRRLYKFDSGEPVGSLMPYGNSFLGCFSNQSRSKTVFSKQEI